jgi:hypothetical protein
MERCEYCHEYLFACECEEHDIPVSAEFLRRLRLSNVQWVDADAETRKKLEHDNIKRNHYGQVDYERKHS